MNMNVLRDCIITHVLYIAQAWWKAKVKKEEAKKKTEEKAEAASSKPAGQAGRGGAAATRGGAAKGGAAARGRGAPAARGGENCEAVGSSVCKSDDIQNPVKYETKPRT